MKPPYLFLFIIFFSCTSSKNTTSSKLYPNNGENLLKNLGVSIVEKEDFYVFDTNDFSVNFPYGWRSYLEPIAKEMIYHSPFKNNKVKSETFIVMYVHNSENPKRDLNRRLRSFRSPNFNEKLMSSIKKSKGKDRLGDFEKKSYSFTRNKKRFQRIKMYYLYERKWLYIGITYPINISTKKLTEITAIKNSIVVKNNTI
ncbi:MAG: hypothetical protein HOM76_07710 [Flavobacteriaceae bacterium]|nr:hypothetical protein [Flavobacteriaceae bacterium]MDB4851714.1 hypothetical protein [Flavobacteriaceae bacterium]